MAIRNIIPDTDEILHKKCRPVEKIDGRIETLVHDMFDTLKEAQGAGLAAPQVGVLKRIFVIAVDEEGNTREFINPEIISEDGTQEGAEACLSIKGFEGFVVRPAAVKVKAVNLKGEEFIFDGTETMARALCHETDHLNGVTIRDTAEYEVMREDGE
jgi:peptide deformylase